MLKQPRFKLPILFILSTFLLIACSSQQSSSSDSSAPEMHMQDSMDMAGSEEAATEGDMAREEGALDLGEKIIETASLNYEAVDFEGTIAYVNEQIQAHEAEIEYSSRWQSSSSYGFIGERISMTLRVPQDQLHAFITTLNDYNDLIIQYQDLQRTDVTKVYRDNETRIEILQEEETVLREMLQEQGSLEEILQIRTRLSELVTQREMFENENRLYDEQIAFSTLNLEIQETDRANNRDTRGFWDRLTSALVDSFYRFIAVGQNLVISFIYLIPYLLIIGVIALIVYYVIRSRRKPK